MAKKILQNLEYSVGFQLVDLVKLKRRFIDVEVKNLGLSRTQWRVLVWMKILAPCSQKELLKGLDIDAAHLTRVLDDFEKNNYIKRTSMQGDRRSLFVQLTDYAQQQIIPHIDEALEREDAALLQGMSDKDKALLIKLLQDMSKNMQTALKVNDKEISK